jgi:hypothetical protein
MRHRLALWLASAAALGAVVLLTVGTAAAAPPQTCSGTFSSPGTLSGSYGNVIVSGICGVFGTTTISGQLVLTPGSTLVAAFAGADLTVNGNVDVRSGATWLGGCSPDEFTCIDDPSGTNTIHVSGNVTETQPLGVVLHGVSIDGNVTEVGGGGGFTCDPSGIFAAFDSPVFSVYGADSHIGGNVTIIGVTSCWLGITHSQIDGSVHVLNNQLADPDAIEILDNTIGGSIVCEQNSMTWDSADITEALYPRVWEPNRVSGNRVGQCVTAPPLTPGGTSPGPF